MSGTEVTTEVQVDNMDDLDAFSNDFFGQKSEEPTDDNREVGATKVEAEQEVVEEAAEVEDQTNDSETEELKEEYVEPAPKKKTVQDRIDELVKQREDVKRDFEAQLAQQRREFETEMARLKPTPETVKAAEGEPTPTDQKEDGTEKYPLGEFDPQYIRDLTRYTLNAERTQANQQAEAQAKEQQAQLQRAQLQTGWNSKLETATQDYPDLLEKGQTLVTRLGQILEPTYAQYLTDTLMEMDHGPEVLYWLSSNPDEAMKIVNSGAKKATLTLGRIEARFADVAAEKLAARPKVTKAPSPPTARARGTNGAFVSVAPDTDDLDAFQAEFFRK